MRHSSAFEYSENWYRENHTLVKVINGLESTFSVYCLIWVKLQMKDHDTMLIEQVWVFWKLMQWKAHSTYRCKWNFPHISHIFCPTCIKFITGISTKLYWRIITFVKVTAKKTLLYLRAWFVFCPYFRRLLSDLIEILYKRLNTLLLCIYGFQQRQNHIFLMDMDEITFIYVPWNWMNFEDTMDPDMLGSKYRVP